uniref:Uncharacterized protein n=1 Tax=Lobelia sonderiana TaxID=673919 RepID=A0A291F039_9ASTR|nr:hypothetical protein Lo_son1Pt0312 [Lobelia sonderiana]ATG25487.1 hypothetical protein Lo_son1Pt0312 [Lobelia sonderiana]
MDIPFSVRTSQSISFFFLVLKCLLMVQAMMQSLDSGMESERASTNDGANSTVNKKERCNQSTVKNGVSISRREFLFYLSKFLFYYILIS